MKDLSAWLSYLEKLHPSEIELGLDRVKSVADKLSLDFSNKTIISVAGTNGKGSTTCFLESLLLKTGKKVGVYRSPHLLRYNERVSLNGDAVSDYALCNAFAKIEEARNEVSLTYFEFGTLAALLIFSENDLDYLVLEVGLGGRLDAVNIVDSDLAIITNVALDHIQWLGDTREKIAYEKSGIMRADKLVLYGESDIPNSVIRYANQVGANLLVRDQDFYSQTKLGKWLWSGIDHFGQTQNLEVNCKRGSMLDSFSDNAALALQAMLLLEENFYENAEADISAALSNIEIPGRFQVIQRGYTLILDVAHNPHAMAKLANNIKLCFPGRKVHVLAAMLADKDHLNSLKYLAPVASSWYVSSLEGSRGSEAKMLYNELQNIGQSRVFAYNSVAQAFKDIERTISSEDVLLVTGSFYTVAAVLELI